MNDRIKYLAIEDLDRFFRAISQHKAHRYEPAKYRALFFLMYRYGLRVTEATKITLDEVNFKDQRIYIRRAKGSVSREYPLMPNVAKVLRVWVEIRGEKPGLLFTSPYNGSITEAGIRKMFKTLAARARLPKDISTHVFRHSIAIHMLNDFADLKDVQDLLGHRSIQSTLVYARIVDKGREKYISSIETSKNIARIGL